MVYRQKGVGFVADGAWAGEPFNAFNSTIGGGALAGSFSPGGAITGAGPGSQTGSGFIQPDMAAAALTSAAVAVPALTGLSGTTTHAVEQGSAVTLLRFSPFITDSNTNLLTSATVQITGGTFSSNETSAADDALSVAAGALTGTNITASYDAASETLTLSGSDTIAHYQSVLAAVRYASSGDNPTNYGNNATRTITWTVYDGLSSPPPGSQNSGTTTISIDAVNDAPVNMVTGTLAAAEDRAVAITGLSIGDVDANPLVPAQGYMALVLSVGHGTLRVNGTGVVGNGTSSIIISGDQHDINALIAAGSLTYTPAANYSGADTLHIFTNDHGATSPRGNEQSDTDEMAIAVASVNDAPATADASVTTLEDRSYAFRTSDFAFSDPNDAPANALLAVKISSLPLTGTLTDDGVAVTSGARVPIADIAAGKLVYTPAADGVAYASFQFSVQDDGGTANGGVDLSAPATMIVNIAATDDAPAVDLDPAQAGFGRTVTINENDSATAIAPEATVTDVDSADFNGGSLLIASSNPQPDDFLDIPDQGSGANRISYDGSGNLTYDGQIIGHWNYVGGPQQISVQFTTGWATPEAVQALVRDVTYHVNGDTPVAGTRLFGFTIDDGDGAQATTRTASITVIPSNDAPTAAIAPPFEPRGTETQVSPPSPGLHQDYVSVAGLAGGGYVMTWTSLGTSDIYSQLYDESGVPQGSVTHVNAAVAANQHYSSVAALPGGGYVIAWEGDGDGSGLAIHSRLYDSSGTPLGAEIQVNTTTFSDQQAPSVAALAGGGYVVAWQSLYQDGDIYGVYSQLFDAAGQKVGAETHVSTATGSSQDDPSVAALAGGGYVVAWESDWQDGSEFGIYSQRYDASGTPLGAETRVNTTTQGNQTHPSATGLTDGGYVVIWSANQDGSGYGVYSQRFDASGSPVGGETQVNVTTPGDQVAYSVAGLADGSYVVTWTAYDPAGTGDQAIYSRHFDASGEPAGSETRVDTIAAHQNNPAVAALAGGGYVIGWNALVQDGTPNGDWAIVSQRFGSDLEAGEQTPLSLKGSLWVGDVDAGSGTETVTLSVDYGVLHLAAGTSGATVTDNDTGSVTITGTIAQIDALLQTDATSAVTYIADGDAPPAAATLTLAISDDGNTGAGGAGTASTTSPITIFAVNDPPSATLPGAQSGTQDADLVFSAAHGNAITISDPDAGASGIVSVQIDVSHGTLTPATTTGLDSWSVNGGNLMITGTLAAVNDALDGLIYHPDLNYRGSDTMTVAVGDNGHSGSGGMLSDSATVGISVAANGFIDGDAGDNGLGGTGGSDFFHLEQGGSDTVDGGDGIDVFYFGGALDHNDQANGGAGKDIAVLQGDYSGGVTLGDHALDAIETLSILSHSDNRFGGGSASPFVYDITTADANVGAGQQLIVNASTLEAGEDFAFDGHAESDGGFFIYGGKGADTLTGGAKADVFFFAEQGRFGSGDTVDGGAGSDILVLRGNYVIDMAANAVTNVETVTLMSGSDARFFSTKSNFSYDIRTADNTVAAGATMTFNGGGLHAGETLHFDGSAEQDGGTYRVFGGADADVIKGGNGNDLLYGGLGADMLSGGGGADTFRYQDTAESTATSRDQNLDFASGDRIDLSRIDANSAIGGNQAFTLVSAFGHHAGELVATNGGSGNLWTISGDVDGDGNADFQLLVTASDSHTIGTSDFLL